MRAQQRIADARTRRLFQEYTEAYAAAYAHLNALVAANDEAAYNGYYETTWTPIHLNAKRELGSELAQYANDRARQLVAA